MNDKQDEYRPLSKIQGSYFYNIEEVRHHLRCVCDDLLGYYVYKGLKGPHLYKACVDFIKSEFNSMVDDYLKEETKGETK